MGLRNKLKDLLHLEKERMFNDGYAYARVDLENECGDVYGKTYKNGEIGWTMKRNIKKTPENIAEFHRRVDIIIKLEEKIKIIE